ncbi:MAG TPA: TIGR02710 family CRISPR-associated protein, partial [Planctomycetaceae bacterium]|nr:TIGR02710 family CRISPR-associated protein [Planctomycetaceae bacterium]
MRTILIVTVGGSHQPILRSIQQNQPDYVCFLCSGDTQKAKGSYIQVDGQGNVLKSSPTLESPDQPNIVTLAGLARDSYEVIRISNFDNLNECYLSAAETIDRLRTKWPDAEIIVDYTGGTKSMTAGLAAAALDDGRCGIQVVTGIRADLNKVTDQTEFVRPISVWDAQVRRRLTLVHALLAQYQYAAASRLLE